MGCKEDDGDDGSDDSQSWRGCERNNSEDGVNLEKGVVIFLSEW